MIGKTFSLYICSHSTTYFYLSLINNSWAGFYFSMSLFFGAMAEMRGKKASNGDDAGVEASAPETKEEAAEVDEVAT